MCQDIRPANHSDHLRVCFHCDYYKSEINFCLDKLVNTEDTNTCNNFARYKKEEAINK